MTSIRSGAAAADLTGADMVRFARNASDWRAYARAHGLSGNWSRARRYSMRPQELHALYLKQNGCCYLCGDPPSKDLAKAAIDHDHACCPGPAPRPDGKYKTSCGKCVRGIAHTACNLLIAEAQDDPDKLRRIADNLEAAICCLGSRRHEAAL